VADEVIAAGKEEGFEMVGEMKEKRMEESDVGVTVGERGRKWIGVKVWFGCVMRLGG